MAVAALLKAPEDFDYDFTVDGEHIRKLAAIIQCGMDALGDSKED